MTDCHFSSRYDGRGHLHSLSQYEAKKGADVQDLDDLEKHEEDLCEEERWRSLHHDDSEDRIRREEEDKRCEGAGGAQFGYNYDQVDQSGVEFGPDVPDNLDQEDDSELYHPNFTLPSGVTSPRTVKQFNVIEKTAALIAGQGPQMEILLKTKQSGNPVFDFLSLDNECNKFYKHLIFLMKANQYKRESAPPPPEQSTGNFIPKISLVPQYSETTPQSGMRNKPSPDCAYSQLITKLQKFAPKPPPTSSSSDVQRSKSSSKESSPAPNNTLPDGPIIIPNGDLQATVDKTASYVAKNGRSFEEIVFSKDKGRFSFLKPGDKHYSYYLHKLNIYLTGNYDPSVNSQPLTFKLNKRPDTEKETVVVLTQNPIGGLDYSSDSDSDGNSDCEKGKSPGVQTDTSKNTAFPNLTGFLPPTIASNPKLYSDPSQETLTEEEVKKREEANKLRDKLAAKAREKMVQVSYFGSYLLTSVIVGYS